jgi:hypothetical protein
VLFGLLRRRWKPACAKVPPKTSDDAIGSIGPQAPLRRRRGILLISSHFKTSGGRDNAQPI